MLVNRCTLFLYWWLGAGQPAVQRSGGGDSPIVLPARIDTSATADTVSVPLPTFFRQIVATYRPTYEQLHANRYARFCRSHNLDPAAASNRRQFHEIAFLHDLFTGRSAVDCRRGGWLGIPYFWHWVEPNPRHAILALPDSVPLVEQAPRDPYRRYQSRADIDRVPLLFLGDLVSCVPGYTHPDCGPFHTFGWCSEREMAFVALLSALGYRGKIEQAGIHTWSVFWCEFRDNAGGTRPVIAKVDNTFDSLAWRAPDSGLSFETWWDAIGEGTQVAWYNRTAREAPQVDGLATIEVLAAARRRITDLVRDGLVELGAVEP